MLQQEEGRLYGNDYMFWPLFFLANSAVMKHILKEIVQSELRKRGK